MFLRNLTHNQKWIVATVYVSGMILNALDSTIVNVTLATLGREFGVEASEIEAVSVAYLVSLAVIMPASGWLSDKFGPKKVLLTALGIYASTNVLAGMAQTLDQLVFARILQGLGGGLIVPVGMALLFRTFPPSERISVGRVLMFATILGPALGPLLGGVILEFASWPWTFFAKVPVATAALLYGWKYLIDEPTDSEAGKLDWLGFMLGGFGLGSSMYAMLQAPDLGWTHPGILIPAILGVTSLTVFVWHELRTPQPMVDLRLISNRLFSGVMRVSFFATAGFLGTLFLVPLFLQDVRGATPLTAGLVTMPEAIGVVISTQIVARIYPRIGPSRLMTGSLLLVAVSIFGLSRVNLETPLWLVAIWMFVIGMAMAGIFLPNQAASMATIPKPKLSGASMLYSVQRQVAGALGVAVMSTVLSVIGIYKIGSDGTGDETNLFAWQTAFVVAAVLSLIGAMFGRFVSDEDAAETMQRTRSA